MSGRMSVEKLSNEAWTHNTKSEFEDGLTFETELKYENYTVKMFRIQTKNEFGNFIVHNDSSFYGVEFYIDGELVLQLADSFVKLFREADIAMAANVMKHTISEIRKIEEEGKITFNEMQNQGEQQ